MITSSWSIAGRLTRWYALSVGALLVTISGISAWFLSESIARELDALVIEELHEMRADFTTSAGTLEDFLDLHRGFDEEHPANPLAWRVWNVRTGERWAQIGDSRLLAAMPRAPGALEQTSAPSFGFRMRTEELTPDLTMCLIVDGTWQIALLRRFFLLLAVVTVVAAIGAVAFGWLMGQRLASHLSSVAEQARNVHAATEDAELQVEGAPEEVREVADALCEMLQNIRRESDRARLMTAGLAHELRSPIQNLLGESEVSLLRERTAEEYRGVIESHIEELRDLARVVDNLVSLCSPTETGRTATLEQFDLGREADIRLGKDRQKASRRDVRIGLERSGDLSMDGDREAILLALHNLVINAINWTPDGGRIQVTLTGSEDAVEFVVDDEGPGVPEAERERIFEPFYRGKSTERGRVGYGLGLALVRTAVLAHGGTIDVGDSPLGGASFVSRIPRHRAEAQMRAAS